MKPLLPTSKDHLVMSTISALSLAGLIALGAASSPASAGDSAISPQLRIAASTLGDLAPYRTIAADTLKIVDKGDVAAARTRIKDLETSWDKAEATLKPKDPAAWTMLDKMIDTALTDLRTPLPKTADYAASLKALLAKMDDVGKA